MNQDINKIECSRGRAATMLRLCRVPTSYPPSVALYLQLQLRKLHPELHILVNQLGILLPISFARHAHLHKRSAAGTRVIRDADRNTAVASAREVMQMLCSHAKGHLSWRRPEIHLARESNAEKQTAEFDACPIRVSQPVRHGQK